MAQTHNWDKQLVHDGVERARAEFHRLLGSAAAADLARTTNGTGWNNEQLRAGDRYGLARTRQASAAATCWSPVALAAQHGLPPAACSAAASEPQHWLPTSPRKVGLSPVTV